MLNKAVSDYVSICQPFGVKHLDRVVNASQNRCQAVYGLNPEISADIVVLPDDRLHETMQASESFLRVAQSGVSQLAAHLNQCGYCVMLVDATGTALSVHHGVDAEGNFKKLGLVHGANWDERRNGTSGIGTALTDKGPVLVHRGEHFMADLELLSCAACPIFDSQGQVISCLNTTSLYNNVSKQNEMSTLYLVMAYARMIENAYFHYQHRQDAIVNISFGGYCNDLSSNLIALDKQGVVVGANRTGQQNFGRTIPRGLLGAHIDDLNGLNIKEHLLKGHERVSFQASGLLQNHYLQLKTSMPVNFKSDFTAKAASRQRTDNRRLRQLIGADKRINHLIERLQLAVNRDIPILITGETGTGKEVFAHAVHLESNRRDGPFVAVNCAAIPESLIESELFGYESGSFTGARKGGMKGKLQQAHGGTLFLDEIGDMPLLLQTRLLRVLAEREVVSIGSDKATQLDVQVVAATHQDLLQKVDKGEFRKDLYFRLCGLLVELPPLRERHDFAALLNLLITEENAGDPVQITEPAAAALENYIWPGNIRELKNCVRVAIAMSGGGPVELGHLPETIVQGEVNQPYTREEPQKSNLTSGFLPQARLSDKEQLLQTLNRHKWNITEASDALNLCRSTVYRKMKRYNIVPPNERCEES